MPSKNNPELPLQNCTLGEAATKFLINLPAENKLKAQQEINKFVRWYGEKRLFNDLTALEVSTYAEQAQLSSTDSADKLEPVKEFLSYAFKQRYTGVKLAPHIKFKKTTVTTAQSAKRLAEKTITLTAQGFAELETELIALKNERPRVTEEIRRAAADKDFRENAPLEAAREYQSHLEGRIRELESALKKATIINDKLVADHKAGLGDMIELRDLTTKTQITYTLVDAREANPNKGKISIVSPIGKAIMGHTKGDTIHVVAPAGTLPYQIIDIKQL
jgi:transcription elongation factor GreA